MRVLIHDFPIATSHHIPSFPLASQGRRHGRTDAPNGTAVGSDLFQRDTWLEWEYDRIWMELNGYRMCKRQREGQKRPRGKEQTTGTEYGERQERRERQREERENSSFSSYLVVCPSLCLILILLLWRLFLLLLLPPNFTKPALKQEVCE